MTDRSALAVLLVTVAVVLTSASVGVTQAMNASGPASAQNQANASNASLGASISAFMQANAAEAEGEVENGMFAAKFENANAERKQQLVHARTTALEKRLAALQQQRDNLLEGADELTVIERARAARLDAQIAALKAAIESATIAAERAGVDTSRLQQLRRNASDLSGPEVAALASGKAGRSNDSGRGPAVAPGEERGNSEAPGDESNGGSKNESNGGSENESNAEGGSGNGQGSGRPEDSGNSSSSGDSGGSQSQGNSNSTSTPTPTPSD